MFLDLTAEKGTHHVLASTAEMEHRKELLLLLAVAEDGALFLGGATERECSLLCDEALSGPCVLHSSIGTSEGLCSLSC